MCAVRLNRRSILLSTLASAIYVGTNNSLAKKAPAGQLPTDDLTRSEIFNEYLVKPWDAANPANGGTLAIPAKFSFPDDALYDCKVNARNECVTDPKTPRPADMMFGIDISHYTDPNFSFNELRSQQVRFVQMKTSQRHDIRDKRFPDFWKRCGSLTGDAKVYRGPYHFLAYGAKGKQQADWFIQCLENADPHGLGPEDMAPGVDLEWDVYKSTGKTDHWAGKGADHIQEVALECLETLKSRLGRTPILYTGKSWFSDQTLPLDRFKNFADYPLWVFDYNPRRKIQEKPVLPDASKPAALWQYTASAKVPDYKKTVDASVFYGTEADFRKTFGIAPV
ncbi:Glycosyl hydrolases family 25 [Mesorhizobium qingshengii]|uniref:Glycosyl hydrolases family 25 n=1 Tax=Mesorhizobium qingshengii TaxID=1165689 RepID=A0A1G5XHW2_9HYPH|nr:Glycosyl hydrolases family 25 [Mesorhizobium qingshengii]